MQMAKQSLPVIDPTEELGDQYETGQGFA